MKILVAICLLTMTGCAGEIDRVTLSANAPIAGGVDSSLSLAVDLKKGLLNPEIIGFCAGASRTTVGIESRETVNTHSLKSCAEFAAKQEPPPNFRRTIKQELRNQTRELQKKSLLGEKRLLQKLKKEVEKLEGRTDLVANKRREIAKTYITRVLWRIESMKAHK